MQHSLSFSIFVIFTGAAVLSTLVLFTRQSLLVAYMLLGVLIGPYGLKWVTDSQIIQQTSEIGIMFLLFLLGLNLHPQKLFKTLKGASWVTLASSLFFGFCGFVVGWLFHYNFLESLIIGAAMMFSSTIIGLKLLPTTILHHRHTGELMISILLLQDMIAILVLLLITASSETGYHLDMKQIVLLGFSLPIMLIIGFSVERFILVRLFTRFDHIKEYIFLVSIAWCLSMAQIATLLGLSKEIGAFIAGVSIATSPIALYISENLKPLRDFFLVMFFFTIGASFDLTYLPVVILPALVLSALSLIVKPLSFNFLLQQIGEKKSEAYEIGVRLAQSSEFSLLLAYLAFSAKHSLIGSSANYLIQAMTIITFFISSYWVVLKYPTPMALSNKMRKD